MRQVSGAVVVKMILIGNMAVGKSTLLHRHSNHEWDGHSMSTIGVDYKVETLQRGETTYKVQIWDTAGQEQFRGLLPKYYRDADAVLLVFALNDRESFEALGDWVGDVRKFNATSHLPIIVVGNKADYPAEELVVSDEEANGFAASIGAKFVKTSAKTNVGVEEAFHDAMNSAITHRLAVLQGRPPDSTDRHVDWLKKPPKRHGGCMGEC
jgi:small GTP-binding protein